MKGKYFITNKIKSTRGQLLDMIELDKTQFKKCIFDPTLLKKCKELHKLLFVELQKQQKINLCIMEKEVKN